MHSRSTTCTGAGPCGGRHASRKSPVEDSPSSRRSDGSEMEHLTEYLGLAGAALLSATVFPFQSELVLLGMLLAEHYQVWLLVLAASLGNILGSCVNWLLGRFIARFEGRRWFPITKEQVAKAERWYHRYGRWSLLLSWVPIIGDPLTILPAGAERRPPLAAVERSRGGDGLTPLRLRTAGRRVPDAAAQCPGKGTRDGRDPAHRRALGRPVERRGHCGFRGRTHDEHLLGHRAYARPGARDRGRSRAQLLPGGAGRPRGRRPCAVRATGLLPGRRARSPLPAVQRAASPPRGDRPLRQRPRGRSGDCAPVAAGSWDEPGPIEAGAQAGREP